MPASAQDPPAIGNGYTLETLLGSGPLGRVWRAKAPGGVPVAIKQIGRYPSEELLQRERDILLRLRDLRHVFLASLQAFWVEDHSLYLVTELAEYNLRGLADECQQVGKGGIPLALVLGYVRDAAEALDFLHRRRARHGNLKPENLLIFDAHVKVADCGSGELLATVDMFDAHPRSAALPYYMAPEVIRGEPCGHSDQYSLAMIYAEARLNRPLFDTRDFMQLILAIMESRVFPDLESLSRLEQSVIRKATDQNPKMRYANCSEFVQALTAAI